MGSMGWAGGFCHIDIAACVISGGGHQGPEHYYWARFRHSGKLRALGLDPVVGNSSLSRSIAFGLVRAAFHCVGTRRRFVIGVQSMPRPLRLSADRPCTFSPPCCARNAFAAGLGPQFAVFSVDHLSPMIVLPRFFMHVLGAWQQVAMSL